MHLINGTFNSNLNKTQAKELLDNMKKSSADPEDPRASKETSLTKEEFVQGFFSYYLKNPLVAANSHKKEAAVQDATHDPMDATIEGAYSAVAEEDEAAEEEEEEGQDFMAKEQWDALSEAEQHAVLIRRSC